MSRVHYRRLGQDRPLPDLRKLEPFRAVLVAETNCPVEFRSTCAGWLVRHGCRYFQSWGVACEEWHDAVDWALLETFHFAEVPEERFVMTTWHENETLNDAFWFAHHSAHHDCLVLNHTVILDLSSTDREQNLIKQYHDARSLHSGPE